MGKLTLKSRSLLAFDSDEAYDTFAVSGRIDQIPFLADVYVIIWLFQPDPFSGLGCALIDHFVSLPVTYELYRV